VLSRKAKESLVIDDRVVVTVVEVKGGRVKLAIEAPSEVPVHRREVFERLQVPRTREVAYAAFP
jgi:carbon storage regulator